MGKKICEIFVKAEKLSKNQVKCVSETLQFQQGISEKSWFNLLAFFEMARFHETASLLIRNFSCGDRQSVIVWGGKSTTVAKSLVSQNLSMPAGNRRFHVNQEPAEGLLWCILQIDIYQDEFRIAFRQNKSIIVAYGSV